MQSYEMKAMHIEQSSRRSHDTCLSNRGARLRVLAP
jgi:hypothetical protein